MQAPGQSWDGQMPGQRLLRYLPPGAGTLHDVGQELCPCMSLVPLVWECGGSSYSPLHDAFA